MLDTLRSIVQEVSAATDLSDALKVVVTRIRNAMRTEVSSVYLYDAETKRYSLMATKGLNQNAVGNVSLATSQGLVGLVGSREELVNTEDAPAHPRYHYLSETGEEKYHSFLGVPIIHHRRLMGVLVVQQQERRKFDESEEAFLVTMSAQLAGVIAHAEATGNIAAAAKATSKPKEARFSGVPGAPGVAIGKAVVIYPAADLGSVPDKLADDVDVEIERFETALIAVRRDIRTVGQKLSNDLRPEEMALFDVYLNMLDDKALGAEVITKIRQGAWAPGALRQVVQNYIGHFEQMDDAYLRERASDIRDLGVRILAYLQESEGLGQVTNYHDNTILVSEELTPAMLGEIPTDKLKGLVSIRGSSNSHVAILARAMGIPTVMGVVDVPYAQLDGLELVVDGYRGRIYSQPSDQLSEQYESIYPEEQVLNKDLEGLRDESEITQVG